MSKEYDIHLDSTLEKEEMNPTRSCNALALYGYHPPSITSSLSDPDLSRNAIKHRDNHKHRYAAEIILHFINVKY